MEKKCWLSLVLFWIIALIFVMNVCAAQAKPGEKPEHVTIAGTFVGMGPYAISAALAQVITKYMPGVKATVESSGGPTTNHKLVYTKKAVMGFCTSTSSYPAMHGIEPFGKKMILNCIMSAAESDPFHIMVDAKSKIYSIKDMRGKKLASHSLSAMLNLQRMQALLEINGMTEKDVTILKAKRSSALIKMLKEGVADVTSLTVAAPSSAVLDLISTKKIRFISLSEREIMATREIATREKWLWVRGTLQAGVYPGQDSDVQSLGGHGYFSVHPDMDEDYVYNLLKAVWNNEKEFKFLQPGAAKLKKFTLKGSINAWSMPYHPGAIKYYKEKGLWTSEHDAKQKKLNDMIKK
ncbi:TAXI family TRAP transporter solute-binding subunit [bacterium]|nr:TAXI family TRAP transporter solute-binding subunit [bacterium]